MVPALHRLADLGGVDRLSTDLVHRLEEAEAAGSALELFDVTGLLPVALTGDTASCEEFVADSVVAVGI